MGGCKPIRGTATVKIEQEQVSRGEYARLAAGPPGRAWSGRLIRSRKHVRLLTVLAGSDQSLAPTAQRAVASPVSGYAGDALRTRSKAPLDLLISCEHVVRRRMARREMERGTSVARQ